MKKSIKSNQLLFRAFVAILFISFNACTEESIIPGHNQFNQEDKINTRNDGPVYIQIVKLKVASRDNIPIEQILTCFYFGQTTQGYWEYHLTTLYDGPKIYLITQIIGDECEGI